MAKIPTPDFKLLIAHPAHFLAFGAGIGLVKNAPGTLGTLLALPLFLLILPLNFYVQITLISALFLIGIYCCDKAGKALGVADHGSIVWDEIVAMMLVLTFTPFQWQWWLMAFILFRLFDIWKPAPIRQCDAKIKGGIGVMLDDILAAIYAILSLKLILWLM